MREFEGMVAWITGGARGIGKAIASEFASRGACLALCDINQDAVEGTGKELSDAHGIKAITAKLDVTDTDGVASFAQRCVDELGGLTVLVNNAGITRDGLLVRMSDDDWDRVISVNLKGAFVCMRAAAKHMMKSRYGKIINIASVVGVTGNPGQANYSASKAGMIGLTKSVARELGPRGVRVNAVAPGYIQTEMTGELSPDVKEAYLKSIPLRYLGLPADVARVCAFLASEAADYVTGQVLLVDGGMHT